jgi:branched-chain amino acid transport system ATP-binding protein
MATCDRIVVLDFGRRIADGTPAEISRNPEVIRAYLGVADGEAEAGVLAEQNPEVPVA